MAPNFFNFLFVLFVILAHFPNNSVADIAAQLEPIDETKEDSSFIQFKKELKVALKKKDSAFIKKILYEDVEYTFGADPNSKSAVDGFFKHYMIKTKDSVMFWKNLASTLELGCTKTGESFVCPYVYSKWPDKFDSFSYVASTKNKTPLRKKPEVSGEIIRSVNFEILKLIPDSQSKDWYTIDLGNNQIGYVAKADARSPIDYRVGFQKTSIGWKLKYFISGD